MKNEELKWRTSCLCVTARRQGECRPSFFLSLNSFPSTIWLLENKTQPVTTQIHIAWIKGGHTRMNCNAVPLQSPVSHCAHWVGMDKNNEPQRGSTMNQSRGIPFINLKVVSVLSSIEHRASSIQFHEYLSSYPSRLCERINRTLH